MMSEATGEDILQTVRSAIQDFVAPSLRELTVRVDGLEKRIETEFKSVRSEIAAARDHSDSQYQALRDRQDSQFQALRDQQDAHFRALLAAISESKAQNELFTYRAISQLTERVAALEAKVNLH